MGTIISVKYKSIMRKSMLINGVNVVPTDVHCMDKQYTETFLKKSCFLYSAEKRKSTIPLKSLDSTCSQV